MEACWWLICWVPSRFEENRDLKFVGGKILSQIFVSVDSDRHISFERIFTNLSMPKFHLRCHDDSIERVLISCLLSRRETCYGLSVGFPYQSSSSKAGCEKLKFRIVSWSRHDQQHNSVMNNTEVLYSYHKYTFLSTKQTDRFTPIPSLTRHKHSTMKVTCLSVRSSSATSIRGLPPRRRQEEHENRGLKTGVKDMGGMVRRPRACPRRPRRQRVQRRPRKGMSKVQGYERQGGQGC
jgi:hypothetical protein